MILRSSRLQIYLTAWKNASTGSDVVYQKLPKTLTLEKCVTCHTHNTFKAEVSEYMERAIPMNNGGTIELNQTSSNAAVGVKELELANIGNKKLVQWGATSLLFIGALLVSAIPEITVGWTVFLTFFGGHVLWLWDSLKDKLGPMIFLNGSFLALDVYAIAIRIFH